MRLPDESIILRLPHLLEDHNRDEAIRIFGGGYWRKGKATYEREN